ncbi:MAG: L,D-transpeptidase, partial [Deltaproteobacteria bacterium]|nr:L,D-transpeptidase [Deltaproteobacteria bacterium]
IWFHGLNKPLKSYDTSGCVALINKDIEDLASYITLNNTPVIISSIIRMAPKEELEEKANDISDIIEGWRVSWQNKDIEKYMSYYSRSFSSGGKNWTQLKEYKTGLAKKYKEINVEIEDLGILTNDDVVIASFRQIYRTPVFESSGIKRLYITKNSEEWKIIGETFSIADAKQMADPTLLPERSLNEAIDEIRVALTTQKSDASHEKDPDAEEAAANALSEDLKERIEGLINSWIAAWETKDTDRYISFYSDGFISDDMNLDAWKKYKDRLNKIYNSISIEISGLKITIVSDDQAEASFIQDYRADSYADYGEKILILIKKGKEWKIKKEKWMAISR